ncbi:hypothetical protein GPJ56_003019 [Histomonas meleagridis]|uniref:uncharacterized protein n=1 Tax=Histomonas meleagridis TaxID=135588 RepID=UPI00355A5608|nr:hypothetical protein GPJ56_003019 [Histomonas meleagridis]KAH0796675.1 hypothetical protein GO595_010568 [Histomonas meleagridis]
MLPQQRRCDLPQNTNKVMLPKPIEITNNEQNITLHLTGASNQTIVMSSSYETANDIARIINIHDAFFICHGRILSPSFSLDFQDVKNGDIIHVVRKKQKPEKTIFQNNNKGLDIISKLREKFDRGWAHKFNDPDVVFEQIRAASNPTTAAESSRLTDLFKTRVEANTSAYKKVCMRYLREFEGADIQSTNNIPTVVPMKSNSPSFEVLPTNWTNSSLASSPQGNNSQ